MRDLVSMQDEMNRISNFVEDYIAGKVTLEGKTVLYSNVGFFSGIPHWTRPDGSTRTQEELLEKYKDGSGTPSK